LPTPEKFSFYGARSRWFTSQAIGTCQVAIWLGETFEHCLTREIAEETTLSITIGPLLGLNQAIDGPYVQLIFACTAPSFAPIKLQPWEHDDARWLSIDEIVLMDRLIPYLARIVGRGMLDHLRQ
jgi:NADH pyrophosphatase NudC (nudix superfamily)